MTGGNHSCKVEDEKLDGSKRGFRSPVGRSAADLILRETPRSRGKEVPSTGPQLMSQALKASPTPEEQLWWARAEEDCLAAFTKTATERSRRAQEARRLIQEADERLEASWQRAEKECLEGFMAAATERSQRWHEAKTMIEEAEKHRDAAWRRAEEDCLADFVATASERSRRTQEARQALEEAERRHEAAWRRAEEECSAAFAATASERALRVEEAKRALAEVQRREAKRPGGAAAAPPRHPSRAAEAEEELCQVPGDKGQSAWQRTLSAASGGA